MWCKSFILYIHFLFKHEQKNESLTEGQDPRKLFYCYWLSFFLTKFAWRCTSKRSDKRNLCMLPGNSSYTDRFVHLSLWFLLWLCYYSLLFFNILLWSFSAYTELKSQWYLIYDFRSCMVLAWDQAPQWENGAVLSLPQSPATLASLADLPAWSQAIWFGFFDVAEVNQRWEISSFWFSNWKKSSWAHHAPYSISAEKADGLFAILCTCKEPDNL